MSKILLFFLSALLLSNNCFAQNSVGNTYGKVSISSPTAAGLGKYADIPVSYHTGIPQISIPIYTVKEGSLELPISLSYHASGLKVMEAASWVGAGWSLNAGGVITRTVRGAPDEKGTGGSYNHNAGHFSDYGYNTYLYRNNDDTEGDMRRDEDFAEGRKDGEPDLFTFNFAGYSGKFYFNDDRTPMLLPEQDLKISYIYTEPVGAIPKKSIQGFTIKTPNGVTYYFGDTPGVTGDIPVERTRVYTESNGMSGQDVVSSWYLNKIVSADNVFVVNLSYTKEIYSYYGLSMNRIEGATTIGGYSLIKNYVNGVRLSSITFSTGKITFIPKTEFRTDLSQGTDAAQGSAQDFKNDDARALGTIQIANLTENLKRFELTYGYFSSDQTNPFGINGPPGSQASHSYKLKLVSVQERSIPTVTIPPYIFKYYDDDATGSVPGLLSFSQDHWGFNNGIKNTGLIPTFTENSTTTRTYTGADRDSHWPAMRNGTIKSIAYPTGGLAEFEFEPNQTWVAKSIVEGSSVGGNSAGFDGSSSPMTSNITLSAGFYKIKLRNYPKGSTAMFKIFPSGGITPLYEINANPGNTTEQLVNLNAGNYRIETSKQTNMTTGSGAESSIIQMNPGQQENAMVGGLRIKSIKKSFNASQPVITNYTYVDPINNLSSGILYGRPTYIRIRRNDIQQEIGFNNGSTGDKSDMGCLGNDGGGQPVLVSPGGIRPMENTQGYHIGYSQVKVAQSNNGYSIYKYYGFTPFGSSLNDVVVRNINSQGCDPSIPNYPEAPIPTDFYRGELKFVSDYREDGFLIKEKSYQYEYTDNPLLTPAYLVTEEFVGSTKILITKYDIKTSKKTKSISTTTNYYANTPAFTTTETTEYLSPYHTQPTRMLSVNSKGETLESLMKYTTDYRVTNCTSGNCLQQYQTAAEGHRMDYVSSGSNFPGWQVYMKNLSNDRKTYISCSLAAASNYASCFQQTKNSSNNDLRPILGLQEKNIITPIEVIKKRNGKIIDVSFNQYLDNINATTTVNPSVIKKVEMREPIVSFTASSTGNDNASLIKDARYTTASQDYTIKYSDGNIVETKKEDVPPTSYIWSNDKQYPVAEAKNAYLNEIYVSDFEYGSAGYDANLQLSTVKSHSGRISGLINNPNTFEKVSHSLVNLTISSGSQKKYVLSGWIYSEGPSVDMFLFMKRPGETGYYSYVDNSTTAVTGKWVYLSKVINVPADVTLLNVRLDNNAAGNVWFDDVHLHPFQSLLSTYTYQPMIGMTNQVDPKGYTTTYQYDPFQRLSLIKDQNNNILKSVNYHYKDYIYYNTEEKRSFQKDCPGNNGSFVTYTVEDGKYSSTLSQEDAQQKAINDAETNGPLKASSEGKCMPVISISYQCRVSGDCNGGNCTVRYAVNYSSLEASQTYTSIVVQTSGNASVSMQGFTKNGTTATANLFYSEPSNNNPSASFDIILKNQSGQEVGRYSGYISHKTEFSQSLPCSN